MLSRSSPALQIFFLVSALVCFPVRADDIGAAAPSVRALLFYDPGSSESRELFAFYLPALLDHHGERLQVSGIDVTRDAGAAAYREAADRLGLAPRLDGQPTVVIGERSFVGLIEIAGSLGDNFAALAMDPDAARWPALPGVEELLSTGVEEVAARVASEGVSPAEQPGQTEAGGGLTPDRVGNALGVVVLVGMIVALIHALMRLGRRDGQRERAATALALMLTLAAGLGISAYTSYTALADVAPVCGPAGGCGAVQDSEHSKLFGIPMGVVGLVGYGLILLSWLVARRFSPNGGGWYWLPWGLALCGVLFSIRLTALGPFVIGATCLWCLGSAVSITITLWLLSGFTRPDTRTAARRETGVRG
jgi:uncharacterized membrane protein